MESVRLDRWLSAARVFRSRSRATEACQAGQVKVNERVAKPPQPVRVGDEIEVISARRLWLLEVVALAEKRLAPKAARELYVDHSPAPKPREESPVFRERGSGRPTKRQRRELRRLVGRD